MPITKSVEARQKWIATTLREVAEFFDVAHQTVRQWRSESPPMPGVPGKFPLKEIFIWYQARQASASGTEKKKDLDLRTSELKFRREEFDFMKEQGRFVEKEEIEQWFSSAVIEMRETIMSLPGSIGASSPPETRAFAISEADRVCREVLTTLRRRLEANVPATESDLAD
jgi:hypothetical protein